MSQQLERLLSHAVELLVQKRGFDAMLHVSEDVQQQLSKRVADCSAAAPPQPLTERVAWADLDDD